MAKGKLRTAAETIFENLKLELPAGHRGVTMTFGRKGAGEHSSGLHLKFIPIGGPVAKASRSAGKNVPGEAGMIQPGPTAKLTQPNVDTRKSECALRQPQMMVVCIAGEGEAEEDAIDAAEDLLERVVIAAKAAYQDEVSLESERWIVQAEEVSNYGITGEAVALMLAFMFPVIHVSRPLIRIGGFDQTCKLDNTLE